MRVKGVILCGGEGRRLRPLTYYFQKTMIPVGSRQKPLLEYIVKLFRWSNIRDILLLVGYKGMQILNYFEDGSRFGVNIEYLEDPVDGRGSGHALYNAYVKGFFDDVDDLLIYYGDIISDISLNDLVNTHHHYDADVTLAIASGYQIPVGVAYMDGERVRKLVEKPWLDLNVTIGVLTVKRDTMDILGGLARDRDELDIMGDFIPKVIDMGLTVVGYRHDGFWYDVGTTEKYEKLDNDVIDKLYLKIEQ